MKITLTFNNSKKEWYAYILNEVINEFFPTIGKGATEKEALEDFITKQL